MCAGGTESKRQHIVEEEYHTGSLAAFQSYVCPLALVSSLKYLGQVITYSHNNWTDVIANLSQAWRKCNRMSRILVRYGTYSRTSGTFYYVLVHVMILFVLEIWVINPRIVLTIGGFHHSVDRRLVGMKLRRNTEGR